MTWHEKTGPWTDTPPEKLNSQRPRSSSCPVDAPNDPALTSHAVPKFSTGPRSSHRFAPSCSSNDVSFAFANPVTLTRTQKRRENFIVSSYGPHVNFYRDATFLRREFNVLSMNVFPLCFVVCIVMVIKMRTS